MKTCALLIISLVFALPFLSNAQGWEQSIGGPNPDAAYALTATADGHYAASGNSGDGLGIDPEKQSFLIKFDGNGAILWTQVYDFVPERGEQVNTLISTSDRGFIIAGNATRFGSYQQGFIAKTDSSGVQEWIYLFKTDQSVGLYDVIESQSGGYLFCGEEMNAYKDVAIGKIDANGDSLWVQIYDESLNDYASAIAESPQGEIIISGVTNRDPGSGSRAYGLAMKTDANGNKIWATQVTSMYRSYSVHVMPNGMINVLGNGPRLDYIDRLDPNGVPLWSANPKFDWSSDSFGSAATADGGFVITGWSFKTQQSQQAYPFMMKVDSLGNKEWARQYPKNNGGYGLDVIQTPDRGFLMAGYEFPELWETDVYLVKTDSLGRLYSDLVAGHVAHDTSLNCQIDPNETPLENWIVEARKSTGRSFYGSTDSSGYYEIEVDTGTYEVILHSTNLYWDVCADSIPLTISNFFDTLVVDFAAQTDIECPYLDVDIATPFLRRCFNNTYTLSYCNRGTATADSAYVDITLDPFMSFISSSLPEQMIAADVYRFQLGDLEVGECNTMTFTVLLDCDSTVLGQTHCVQANIYPDSLCIPVSSDWSGAFIEVEGECQDSILNFKIKNTGNGNMSTPLHYVIIEDAILLMTAPFELNSGAAQDVPVPNNDGSTYFLYAEQEPGAPGYSLPILSVEGCVATPGLPFSRGFVNQFPQNDGNPFVEIDCRENIGSYDPNDKQAFPIGYGPQHLIEDNTDIEYLIRFQNTGTDTAFKVVIVDTLSQWLNPISIQPGVSSHAYEFNLSKDGIATFTFDNIMLPDSNVNLDGSNGFVKFRIAQQLDNPIGTRIENQAAIYFDFNPPIFTNTTFHTIGEDLIDIVLDIENPDFPLAKQIKVYPNPTQGDAQFELQGLEGVRGQFQLFNSSGQLIRNQDFTGNQFTFERQQLPTGLYLFSIQQDGQLIGQGKIVIH